MKDVGVCHLHLQQSPDESPSRTYIAFLWGSGWWCYRRPEEYCFLHTHSSSSCSSHEKFKTTAYFRAHKIKLTSSRKKSKRWKLSLLFIVIWLCSCTWVSASLVFSFGTTYPSVLQFKRHSVHRTSEQLARSTSTRAELRFWRRMYAWRSSPVWRHSVLRDNFGATSSHRKEKRINTIVIRSQRTTR